MDRGSCTVLEAPITSCFEQLALEDEVIRVLLAWTQYLLQLLQFVAMMRIVQQHELILLLLQEGLHAEVHTPESRSWGGPAKGSK